MTFLLAAGAVFTVWEALRTVLPWRIPPVVQPLIVVGLAVGALHVPALYTTPLSVAAVVAVLHALLGVREPDQPMVIRRGRSNLPPLP